MTEFDRRRGLVKVLHNGSVEIAAFERKDGMLLFATSAGGVSRHRPETDVVKQVEYLLKTELSTIDSLRSNQERPDFELSEDS
jgi:hypothetical protein